MITRLDCIPCIQKQALTAARMNNADEEQQKRILKGVISQLLKADWKKTPPELAEAVQRTVRKEIGIKDPYLSAKQKYNAIALSMYPELKKIVEKSKDPIKTAARLSIAGNIIDFGPASEEEIDVQKTIEYVMKAKISESDFAEFKEKALNSKTALFFADNSGEIVFDRILIETILQERKKTGKKGFEKISYAVKGGPILNDAMIEDAKEAGFEKIPNILFLETSNGEPETGPERNSPQVKEWIKKHDFVVSKGQGNYEGLSDFRGLFFLLMAKCHVIASHIGAKKGQVILKKQ
jgi:damage-control phosphatase, subfamily I